jgi:hypothetical protein
MQPKRTKHLECDLRVLSQVEKGLAWQLHHMEFAERDHGCGSGRAVEEAQLSEVVAGVE